MKQRQQENSKGDLMNQRLIAEINNLKDNNKVLDEILKVKKKTILQYKNTLKVMNGANENAEGEIDNLGEETSTLSDKKKRLNDLLSDTREKTKQLEEMKNNYMQTINLKDERIKQLKEKLGIVD